MGQRKLTDKAKQEIRQAFQNYGGVGVPEDALLRLCADHAIGLLELDGEVVKDWFVPPEPTAIDRLLETLPAPSEPDEHLDDETLKAVFAPDTDEAPKSRP